MEDAVGDRNSYAQHLAAPKRAKPRADNAVCELEATRGQSRALKIAAALLLNLEALEECFEVALAETL